MKIIIKHIDVNYVDHTTFDDPEPDLLPVDVDIHYTMYQEQNEMPGKMTLNFDDYEVMNHRELIQHLQLQQQRHLQSMSRDIG